MKRRLAQVVLQDGEWYVLDQDHTPSSGPITDPEDGERVHERNTWKVWEYGPLPKRWWQRTKRGWFVVGDDIRKMPEYN